MLLFEVTCVGQVIGAVVADTQRHAQLAAKKVRVDYEEQDAIFTIEVRVSSIVCHSTSVT